MNKKIHYCFNLFLCLFLVSNVFAQVGINNTDPKATLDITAIQVNNSTAEGLIAPRLTGDQIKAKDAKYGTDQTGAIIYASTSAEPTTAKTINITKTGYYYFNGAIWVPIGEVDDDDTTDDALINDPDNDRVIMGTESDGDPRDTNAAFVVLDNGNTGIGISEPTSRMHIVSNGTGNTIGGAEDENLQVRLSNLSGGSVVQLLETSDRSVRMGINTVYPNFGGIGAFSMNAYSTKAGEDSADFLGYDFQNKNLILLSNTSGPGSSPGNNVGIGVNQPTSKLQVGGSFSAPIRISNGSSNIGSNDYTVVYASNQGSPNLPDADTAPGRIYNLSYLPQGTSSIRIDGDFFYDGAAQSSITLNNTFRRYTIQSTGNEWIIISRSN